MYEDKTFALRLLMGLMLFGLLCVLGLLYLISLEGATNWPELAHLRVPIFIAITVGAIPIVMGVKAAYGFLRLVDRGEAFSADTVALFRRLRLLLKITASYLTLGLVGTWIALGQMHFTILFAWAAFLVVLLFLLVLASLLQQLFETALELREDHEATV